MKLLKLHRAFLILFYFCLYLNGFKCNLNDFLKKIIPTSVKCINLIEENNKVEMKIHENFFNEISVYRKNYKNFIETNISLNKEVNCDFFIFFSNDKIFINNIFTPKNNRIFYPFTKFLIIYFGDKEFNFNENSLKFIYLNAFDVFSIKLNKTFGLSEKVFHTIENKTIFWKNSSKIFYNENNLLKAHLHNERTVRVSLFNCSPFVLTRK